MSRKRNGNDPFLLEGHAATVGRVTIAEDPMTSSQVSHFSPDPKVSVLLAVHNGEDYLESAMRSVMEQSLTDIEILVVDDASSDGSPAILQRLAAEDTRIRIERLNENRRLPGALNRGLELVRGTYVARMDADDLSHPRRLEVQAGFLDSHPEVTLIGCSTLHIDGRDYPLKTSVRSQDPFATRWMCRFVMPFRHPTFMFRRAEMKLCYDPACTVSEDYDILARLSQDHAVGCIPDVLLSYREHGGSLTGTKWRQMLHEAREIAVGVQSHDLSPEVFGALEPFRAAYFDLQPLNDAATAAMFDGLHRMVMVDVRTSPAHGRWVWRQTAQLAAQALMRSGCDRREILSAFAGPGRIFLTALAMRFFETRGRLPRKLRSDAEIWQ